MNNYNVIRQIGKGAFSNVYLCKNDKVRSLLSSIERFGIGILEEKNDFDDLFIIKEINIDNLVKKYMYKSRSELLHKIKDDKSPSLSGTASVNITPYNKGVFNKKIMKKLDTE